ncbi:hypothetical protein BKA65DRAFT_600054 [Rhexocercosporidium sp. MPI-PUGE-AT-0058]|nr:hypothetical protein BKA65DRAFT_600054 [Rhexocercosporidium sp. MPI-PUGE-AT-0058]
MKDVALALSLVLGLNLYKGFPSHFGTVWAERISQKQGKKKPLLSLVIMHWMAEATLGHDKIYALCGLSSDAGPGGLDIRFEYEKSVEAAYTNFAAKVLRKYRNLDILSALASYTSGRACDLPSWVPDWRVHKPNTVVYTRPEEGIHGPCEVLFNATKESLASPRFDISNNRVRLPLSSMIIDAIKVDGAIQPDHHTTTNGLKRMFHWRYDIARYPKKKKYSPTGEKMFTALYETMTMGNLSALLDDSEKQYEEFDKDLITLSVQNDPFASCYSTRVPPRPVLDNELWDSKVFTACQVRIFRKLIRTKKEFLGLVHSGARAGDSIALLEGGALPLVIRRSGDDWVVVGDGYIHGAMHGELFKEKKCKPFWFY